MKHLMAAILGVCALSAFSKEPNVQSSFHVYMFEQTKRFGEGISVVGSMMDMREFEELAHYGDYGRYPELREIEDTVTRDCRQQKEKVENTLYNNNQQDKVKVDVYIEKVARMLRKINDNNHMIVELEAEIGSACHLVISAVSDAYALAETKTVMGNKAQDCENKLEDNKTAETVIQKIKTGWSLFNLNYCRIDQYEVVEQ